MHNAFSVSTVLSTPYLLHSFLIATVIFYPYPKLPGVNQNILLNFVTGRKVSCLSLQCPDRSEPSRSVYLMPHSPRTAMKMRSKIHPEGSMERVMHEERFYSFERCCIGKVTQLSVSLICYVVACR